jgi:hypothetical protein
VTRGGAISQALPLSSPIPSSPIVWGYRLFTLLIVAAMLLLLDPRQILMAFAVIGQGHIFIAWIHQARAGIITRARLISMILVGACIFGAFTTFLSEPTLIAATSLYFVLHFLVDEKRLLGERPDFWTLLEVLPVLLMYLLFIMGQKVVLIPVLGGKFVGQSTRQYFSDDLTQAPLALGVATLAALILIFSLGRRLVLWQRPSASTVYFHVMSIGMLALFALGYKFWFADLMGAIILYHYFNWYCHYFFKTMKSRSNSGISRHFDRDQCRHRLRLFMFSYEPEWPEARGVFFRPDFFFMWTLMHLIYSNRPGEFWTWLAIPGRSSS